MSWFRSLSVGLMAVLFGCGDSGEPVALTTAVSLAFPADLQSCPARDSLKKMTATLYVGGHEGSPCNLIVDESTLKASGSCGPITTRRIRYLLVIYNLAEPTNPSNIVPLADLIGWVDLSTDALKGGESEVKVAMVADDVNGAWITTQAQLDALATAAKTSQLMDSELTAYARLLKPIDAEVQEVYGPAGQKLDCAPSGVNLISACNGDIFRLAAPSCHQP